MDRRDDTEFDMAFRFRKSVKIAPGIRLNIGKKGISTSIGGRGATVNISKRGTRVTTGLPGTGLSSSHLIKPPSRNRSATPPPEYSRAEWAFAAAVLEVLAVFCWVKLTGFLAFAGAAIALGIPGIYLAIWIGKQREEVLMAEELAQLARERDAKEAQSSHSDDVSSNTNEHWSEIVKRNDARRKSASPIRCTAVIPASTAEEVSAACIASDQSIATDYLGQAAATQRSAKEAAKAGEFNKAWGLFHKQKELYLCHAQSQEWSAGHTLALDASVHENLANVLRAEKRHRDALPHIIYWVAASRDKPIKRHTEKLGAYFKRCKLVNTTLDDVQAYLSNLKGHASYSASQKQVKRWIQEG